MTASPLDQEDVQDFVRDLIADFVEIQVEEVDTEADIFEVYAIESLQLVEMIAALERKFGKRLEFDDFREARTSKEIAERVLITPS